MSQEVKSKVNIKEDEFIDQKVVDENPDRYLPVWLISDQLWEELETYCNDFPIRQSQHLFASIFNSKQKIVDTRQLSSMLDFLVDIAPRRTSFPLITKLRSNEFVKRMTIDLEDENNKKIKEAVGNRKANEVSVADFINQFVSTNK